MYLILDEFLVLDKIKVLDKFDLDHCNIPNFG